MKMELSKELKDDILLYCKANKIENIDDFIVSLVKQGLTVIKFGATPTPKEKIVEKIVEKLIEVPIEKIVEKLIEVPIEKIVEKEIYITDDVETKKLSDKLVQSIQNEQECKAANILMQSQITLNGETSVKEIIKLKAELSDTKRLLEEEKNKVKNKDIYGEK
jgi:D-Tyr-tRNAtyr deacylase